MPDGNECILGTTRDCVGKGKSEAIASKTNGLKPDSKAVAAR